MLTELARLLHLHPLVFFHLVTALCALLLGGVVLARRKGNSSHRALGWTWVGLMASTTLASACSRDYRLPKLFGFTPTHARAVLVAVLVAVMRPLGIWFIRRGNVVGHRLTLRGLYIGACGLAGLFTLLPGRFLGRLLWQHGLGLV